MAKPRVLLADDHALVAEGLQKILEPEVEVVGTVEDGRALLAHGGLQVHSDATLRVTPTSVHQAERRRPA